MILGNTAGNTVFFAEKAIGASQRDPNNAEVRDISNAAITFAYLINVFWLQGSLGLNSLSGLIKAALMLMLFIVGATSAASAIRGTVKGSASVAKKNLNLRASFTDLAVGAYGFAEAFLAILFAHGDFNQTDYT
jgi:hypothetical protein